VPFCKSYIDYPTTVPHIGGDSMAWQLFCTTALPDDGPVRPETWKSFVNEKIIVCAFCWSIL